MTAPTKPTEAILAPGLKLRAAQWSDVNAVTQLIYDVCAADGDASVAVTAEELAREWKNPGFVLEKDAWVVETSDGRVIGYEEFGNRYAHASLYGDGYVHHDFMNLGVGTVMLHALEVRAREDMELAESDLRIFIRNGMAIGDKVARDMHEHEGYKPIRFSWRMEIRLESEPASTIWPKGIELRPFNLSKQNHHVFEAVEEAFSDHWGHTPSTYEKWQHQMTGHENFDPTLWHIAWDGNQIAGFSLCRYRMDIGWVGLLGVRRPWRKRGLGLALLNHSFEDFHRRGKPVIGLGVDAQNPTGATQLYKKAGMYVASEYVIYEKELRAGHEPEGEE
jgi:mycothiol synthase